MQWIKVNNIRPTPEGNVECVVAATGKPLVLSMAQVMHRNGGMLLIDDWLYKKLAPYLVPGRVSNERQSGKDRQDVFRDGNAGPVCSAPAAGHGGR
jgi:hypothetical protein